MAKIFDEIDEQLAAWIRSQPLFFVGTAPARGGHVNVSPKGPIESLRIPDGHTLEYDDHVGSGAETAAHLRENGRICVMLCAFDGPPRILRLHGRGEVIPADDPGADGIRGTIRIHVERIADSCGFDVPLMALVGGRTDREQWLERQSPQGVRDYVRAENERSIDGLPAFN